MPLGLGYIAACIKSRCPDACLNVVDTTFFDAPMKKIEKALGRSAYDLVGFSVMTTMIKESLAIAAFIKENSPHTRIVFGGPHPTVMPSETLAQPQVDAVVLAEGEQTAVEIVQKKGDFTGIPGIWYKDNGRIVKNPPRPFCLDLDSIPFPERDLFPVEQYIANNAGMDSVDPSLRCLGILASRGCHYRCSYCQPTLNRIFGKKVRIRSPENIIAELAELKSRYRIDSFMFEDDTFIIRKQWVHDFCDALIKSGLKMQWFCNVRANLVEYDMIRHMYDAGLRKVGIGIESGSQRVLDEIYTKDITIEQVCSAVSLISSLGIKIQGYVMLGAPTETRAEILETIRFTTALDIDEAAFSITTPLPQTTLYNKSRELIDKDVTEFDYYKTSVYRSTGECSPDEIERLKRRAYLVFYFSHRRLLKTIRTLCAVRKMLKRLKRF